MPLISADEARRRFAAAWTPAHETEVVATSEALGRVLAQPVAAPEDLPPFRRALMDGFACRAADLAAAPVVLRVVGEVAMGAPTTFALDPGEAARIPTGGMLPEGADVVVPVEQAAETATGVRVEAALAAGRHVIERGGDVRAGEPVLGPGHRLRAPDVGALMGLGLTTLRVYRLPVVAILSTGDEVVPAEETPPFGKIRDLNSHAVAASVQALGAIPRRLGIVPDEADALLPIAREALAGADVLILNGGTSVGPRDVVAAVIAQLGAPGLLVHGVNIRPGKPTIFAVCDGKPVFGLPGQPVSVLNTFEQFVAPVLRRLLWLSEAVPTRPARLAAAVRSADGREDHVRVRLEERADGLWATPIEGVSAMISTMVGAGGITIVPAGSPGFAAGETVEVRLLV